MANAKEALVKYSDSGETIMFIVRNKGSVFFFFCII